MYEEYTDEIVDAVLTCGDNNIYVKEMVNEILLKISQRDGEKAIHILNTIIVEHLNRQNYSQEIIYKILNIVEYSKK